MTARQPTRSYIPTVAWQRLRRRSLTERRWSTYTLWGGILIVVLAVFLSSAAP